MMNSSDKISYISSQLNELRTELDEIIDEVEEMEDKPLNEELVKTIMFEYCRKLRYNQLELTEKHKELLEYVLNEYL